VIGRTATANRLAGSVPSEDVRKSGLHVQPEMASIAAHVRMAQMHATTAYYPIHRQWAINHALYVGNQYAVWSDAYRRMVDADRVPKHRVRVAVNVVMPVIQTMSAMILKGRPEATVVPASQDLADKNAARAAERIYDYLNQDLRLVPMRLKIIVTMLVKGCCFAKVIWNHDGGPKVEAVDEETGEPLVDPETGEPLVDPETRLPIQVRAGKVEVEVVPPEQILPDPTARSWEDVGWLIHTRRRSLAWIRDRYPEWGFAVNNEPDEVHGTLEAQNAGLTAAGSAMAWQGQPVTPSEGARVNEIWLRPGVEFAGRIWKNGAVLTQVQQYVKVQPIDYLDARGADPDIDWHPFVMARCLEGARFWPVGIPDNIAPLQREVNRITSNIIEAQRLMSRPKWLIPNSANVSRQSLTSEPGEKVYYNSLGGAKPEAMAMPDLPSFVPQILEYMKGMVDFVSNQHGPSRGMAPSNIRSGIGLSLLQEQDAVDLGPLVVNWEGFEQGLARQLLMRVSQFWQLERVVSVIGHDKRIESFAFKGADVGRNVDIRIHAGSGLPKSKAATQALVRELVELGLYHPMLPKHRRTLLSMMELGIGDDYGRSEDQDHRWAEYENELMAKGMPSKVEWFENHPVHIEAHLDFRKTDMYRNAVARNPAVAMLFDLHVAQHASPQNMAATMVNPASPFGPQAERMMGQGAGGGAAGLGHPAPSNAGAMPGLQGLRGTKQNMAETTGTPVEENPTMGG